VHPKYFVKAEDQNFVSFDITNITVITELSFRSCLLFKRHWSCVLGTC